LQQQAMPCLLAFSCKLESERWKANKKSCNTATFLEKMGVVPVTERLA